MAIFCWETLSHKRDPQNCLEFLGTFPKKPGAVHKTKINIRDLDSGKLRYCLQYMKTHVLIPTIDTNLTLCHSYLNPYCLGRKTAFFSVGI
jgi:hypothetical protein